MITTAWWLLAYAMGVGAAASHSNLLPAWPVFPLLRPRRTDQHLKLDSGEPTFCLRRVLVFQRHGYRGGIRPQKSRARFHIASGRENTQTRASRACISGGSSLRTAVLAVARRKFAARVTGPARGRNRASYVRCWPAGHTAHAGWTPHCPAAIRLVSAPLQTTARSAEATCHHGRRRRPR